MPFEPLGFSPLVAAVAHAPDVERTLLKVLIQFALILACARVFAIAFRKLGQPSVVGETAAGLALGPSLFGHFFPSASTAIFDPSIDQVFKMFSQLGLILLLFMVGLEFDFSHLKKHGRSSLLISLAGIALPFGLGWLLARRLHASLALDVPLTGFALFMGTAMSITAIPVLARIMMELNITPTRLGAITITAAAIDDATGWIMLASVSAVVNSSFAPMKTALMALETIAFAAFVIFVLKPPLARLLRRSLQRNRKLSVNWLAAIFVILFLCAIATNLIGIFAIFGAFLFGAALSTEHDFNEAIAERIRDLVTALFLPIFFAYTGLRTEIGALNSSVLWLSAAMISACAILGKFGGCTAAARVSGFNWRESSCIGAMMNTRGLMELIVINAGYELGVIPKNIFCMLVLMAIVTTVMTVPLLLRIMRGTELEPWISQSSFVAQEAAVVADSE
ncbi:MAG TPA: cation:proton antiporter [Planctomycetota bacterium]|nr:cation:proton antiporter [Planctomycetota bacterium]